MACETRARRPGGRPGRPSQRRQVDLVQSHHRHPTLHRHGDCRHDPRRQLRSQRSGRTSAFTLIDTGGMFGASKDPLHELVYEHGQARGLPRPRSSCFVVDGREGLVPGDEEIASAACAA